MDNTILIWAIGGGFAGTWMMMFYMIKWINDRIDKLDVRLNKMEMDMVEVKTILRMVEGNLQTHGHCLFNQSHKEKKVEWM